MSPLYCSCSFLDVYKYPWPFYKSKCENDCSGQSLCSQKKINKIVFIQLFPYFVCFSLQCSFLPKFSIYIETKYEDNCGDNANVSSLMAGHCYWVQTNVRTSLLDSTRVCLGQHLKIASLISSENGGSTRLTSISLQILWTWRLHQGGVLKIMIVSNVILKPSRPVFPKLLVRIQ